MGRIEITMSNPHRADQGIERTAFAEWPKASPVQLPRNVRRAIDEGLLANTELSDPVGRKLTSLDASDSLERHLAEALRVFTMAIDNEAGGNKRRRSGVLASAERERLHRLMAAWRAFRTEVGSDIREFFELVGSNVWCLPGGAAVDVLDRIGNAGDSLSWFAGWLRVGDNLTAEAEFRFHRCGSRVLRRGEHTNDGLAAARDAFIDAVLRALVASGEGVSIYENRRRGRTAELVAVLLAASGQPAPRFLKRLLVASHGRVKRQPAAPPRSNTLAAICTPLRGRPGEAEPPSPAYLESIAQQDSENREYEARWARHFDQRDR